MKIFYKKILRKSKADIKVVTAPNNVPKVSVVIPCYNYGRFLRGCVDSVMNQESIELEIIIVDDHSEDDTLDVAKELVRQDGRVKLIHHESRKGHIATYNDGLDAVTGEFVLLLSADDLVAPNALSRAAAFLTAQRSVGLVYGNVVDFNDEVPASRDNEPSWITWSGVDWLEQRCRSGYNVVAGPSAVMRTSVLRSIGGYRPDLPHAGDFEMWLRTAAVADIGFIAGVYQGYYRLHSVNMHKKKFRGGTHDGQLVDLKERWKSFEAVFQGPGGKLSEAQRLFDLARRTIAEAALELANYAYARGFRDFPVADFENFANEVDPDAGRTKAGRALARRKKLGMISLPLHPLWALPAIRWRLAGRRDRLRRLRIGA